MVGTLEPRKNHATALRALARLKAWGLPHRLVIAGGSGWLFEPIRQQVADLGLAGDVTFAGYVPAADLPPLYSGAACVLAPSLYEGFGFPVLEAIAGGTPSSAAMSAACRRWQEMRPWRWRRRTTQPWLQRPTWC